MAKAMTLASIALLGGVISAQTLADNLNPSQMPNVSSLGKPLHVWRYDKHPLVSFEHYRNEGTETFAWYLKCNDAFQKQPFAVAQAKDFGESGHVELYIGGQGDKVEKYFPQFSITRSMLEFIPNCPEND